MVQGDAGWSRIVQGGAGWSRIVQSGARGCRVVQLFAIFFSGGRSDNAESLPYSSAFPVLVYGQYYTKPGGTKLG